jgi:hypothetical protein
VALLFMGWLALVREILGREPACYERAYVAWVYKKTPEEFALAEEQGREA